MRCILLAGLTAVALCLPVAARAQAQEVVPLATDFEANGKVLELDVSSSADGTRFLIVWLDAAGEQFTHTRVVRAGRHSYEMRHLPGWHGFLRAVAITLPEASGRVQVPTISDEIDMFLEPERLTPSTVNVLKGHTLFAWSWDGFLLLVLLASALCFAAFKRKRALTSLVLGFVVSWGVMDLRAIYDHAVIVYKAERYEQGMDPLTEANGFADRASEEMTGPETWSHELLDPLVSSLIRYRLAEHEYIPSGSDRTPTFWITQDPNEREIVRQHENYYLVKANRP